MEVGDGGVLKIKMFLRMEPFFRFVKTEGLFGNVVLVMLFVFFRNTCG